MINNVLGNLIYRVTNYEAIKFRIMKLQLEKTNTRIIEIYAPK